MANNNEEITLNLQEADAGYNISPSGSIITSNEVVNPYENQSNPQRNYETVRGDDAINSVLNNGSKLQFTEDQQNDYLRLLMPKYTRRVEVEDLNRNFWVIGQTLNYLSRNFNININKEDFRFEKTLEKDRDGHNYSDYPHKIVFNEGYEGIKTPYMVKDYCYHSNELESAFEEESIWYRQFGGINSADQAYIIGGGGAIPFLNFYKPRPDAIPIFSLTQTESSDIESFNAGDEYKKVKGSELDEDTYMNLLGRTNTFLCDGDAGAVDISFNFFPEGSTFNPSGQKGQIVIANVPELVPLKVYQEDGEKEPISEDVPIILPTDLAGTTDSIRLYSTGSKVKFNQFSEGQIIHHKAKLYSINTNEMTLTSKGTIGVNGTIESLPLDEFLGTGNPEVGDYYRVITEGNYQVGLGEPEVHAKKEDWFVCYQVNTDPITDIRWVYIPCFDEWYVKSYNEVTTKNGYTVPKSYIWKKVVSNELYESLSDNEKKKCICREVNSGILALNHIDQRFLNKNGMWHCLDNISFRDGPTVPQYKIVENGSIFRVLGDSSTEILDGGNQTPTINGSEYSATKKPHDVVRYNKNCFEWWNSKWRQIRECDAAFVNIFIWLPEKTSTLRGVYYWTLKWLIPPGIGEYE